MRPMGLLAMGFGALLLAAAGAGAQDAAGLTKTDRTGPVTVEVTPLPPATAGEPLKLEVVFDTHSVNLDAVPLERVVVVRSGAGAVAPVGVESAKGSGHHRAAVLVYPGSVLAGGATALEVVVKEVGGVPERTFRWDLPLKAAAAPRARTQAQPVAQAQEPAPSQQPAQPGGGPAAGPGGGMPGPGMGMMGPGMGTMGGGMMMGMRHQMMGMMQQMGGMMQQMGEMMAAGQMSPEQAKQMGELMQQMGEMMAGMGSVGMGGGPMGPRSGAPQAGPGAMPDMSQMMERMAEMQKRMSEMMRAPK